MKVKSHLYGFEDYAVIELGEGCFIKDNYYYINDVCQEHLLICKNLISNIIKSSSREVSFNPDPCKNHSELLNTAKKIYIHPNCNLSRSVVAAKYSKSLNPFLSDAVIIPKPNYNDFYMHKVAMFVNEAKKFIVMINMYSTSAIQIVECLKEGALLGPLMLGMCGFSYSNIQDIYDSEFFYYGNILGISAKEDYIIDVLTGKLPNDKIVYEESVQESLSDSSTQITFDNMVSIADMLDSTDSNTVSAGLKALSMMDWIHYANSIKFLLGEVSYSHWKYNKAASSVSVKYMLKTISGNSNRRYWPGRYNSEITKQDYELLKQLKMHYQNIKEEDIFESIKYLPFAYISGTGNIAIRIKE